MKEKSEKRTEAALEVLLKSLSRNVEDTGIILDEFEATHDDYECDQSRQYSALVAGYFAMKESVDKINNRLNK